MTKDAWERRQISFYAEYLDAKEGKSLMPHEKMLRYFLGNLPSRLTADMLKLTEVNLVTVPDTSAEQRFYRMQEYQWFCKRARMLSKRDDIRKLAGDFLSNNKLFVDTINKVTLRNLMDETFAKAFYKDNRELHKKYK